MNTIISLLYGTSDSDFWDAIFKNQFAGIIFTIGFSIIIIAAVVIFLEILFGADSNGFFGIAGFTIGIVMILLSSFAIDEANGDKTKAECTRTETSIVALQNGSKIGGAGTIIYAQVDQKSVLRYATKDKDGAIRLNQIDDTNSKDIAYYEDATEETARIEKLVGYCENGGKKNNFFLLPVRYNVHVPKGTLVQNFELDLNKQ